MEQQGKPLPEEELKNIELRTELFNRYILPNKNLVYRLCIRYTYLQENIADNYSEALVNFFKYITTYDPTRSILNWIHIVTKRFVMEQNRRHGRLPEMLPRRTLPQAYRRPLSGTLPLAP